MHLLHRAHAENLTISSNDEHWIFEQVVFFRACDEDETDEDLAEQSYSQGDADHVYVLQLNADVIEASALAPDAAATAELRKLYGKGADVASLLDGSAGLDAEEAIEDGPWHLQRIRAQVARRAGFHAVRDADEQGEVYAVDFTDRCDELNAMWRYVGRRSELLS